MELTLDLSLVLLPKTISEFVGEISTTKNCSEKLSKLDGYVQRLEDERRKIEGFKRELPLSMLLLNDVIGRLKEEAMQCMESNSADKKNWMSSAQLWITGNDYDYKKEDSASEATLHGEEDGRSIPDNPVQRRSNQYRGGTIASSKAENDVSEITSLSLTTPHPELNSGNSGSKRRSSFDCGGSCSRPSFMTNPSRKQRRHWSPQLHRRFFEAIKQLGGEQVATPKQIRELMQVDGLTNDEVKSHLQKYRLHLRKLPSSSATNGLWMAQDQFGEDSKLSTSQSASPQGTLLASGSAKGLFSGGEDSKDAEGDEKSDGRSWKGGQQEAGEDCRVIHSIPSILSDT